MAWVLLDRDGVINEDSHAYIKSPDEWQPIPGSPDAIALLHRNGYRVAVLTNQSGIARGLFDRTALELIHKKMRETVEQAGGHLDDIFYCPHGPEDGCNCRKPKAGLYEQFARKYGADLRGIPVVGDSLRDVQSAQSVGASPILVETGKGVKTLKRNPDLDVPSFTNLYEAVQYILYTRP